MISHSFFPYHSVISHMISHMISHYYEITCDVTSLSAQAGPVPPLGLPQAAHRRRRPEVRTPRRPRHRPPPGLAAAAAGLGGGGGGGGGGRGGSRRNGPAAPGRGPRRSRSKGCLRSWVGWDGVGVGVCVCHCTSTH